MSRFSLSQFIDSHAEQTLNQGHFELESERVMEINLNGLAYIKVGAMVAYRGSIGFEREGMLDKGVGAAVLKALTGEGARLTKAKGQGKLYVADGGKLITILNLNNESIFVNGNDLLALQDGLRWDIKMMRKVSAIASGGLFNVQIGGTGLIAITTHGRPMALRVTPDSPVFTDPQATVAWSSTLTPELKTDFQLKSLFGRGSGETFQMHFTGSGFVVVQPYEELPMQQPRG